MVGIAIGLLLIAGLSIMFANSSQSYGEMHKEAQQIESGRYAFDVLRDDLQHAGYVGSRTQLPAVPGSLPDPCDVSVAALATAIALPVQAYDSPSTPPSPISACLADADHVAGTDILVIRRADSAVTTLPITNERYVQASASGLEVQAGNPSGFALPALNPADNSVQIVGTKADGTAATVFKMMNVAAATPTITLARVAADIRKLHVHVYFIAPCSRFAAGQTGCTTAADGGTPIPTLKRLELGGLSGGGTVMLVRPIAEGIENLQIEFGVDTSPAAVNLATGFPGDGVIDSYAKSLAGVGDWANVMSVRLFVLARNSVATFGSATGSKTYALGLEGTVTPTDTEFRRHLFEGEVRLANMSSRREEPK